MKANNPTKINGPPQAWVNISSVFSLFDFFSMGISDGGTT